jgi:hypothetical protein
MNRYVDVMNMGQEAWYYANNWKFNARRHHAPHFTREKLDKMIEDEDYVDENGEPVQSIGQLARFYIFYDFVKKQLHKTNFTRAMEFTYGEAMRIALDEMIGDIREIRNQYTQAITLMNAIFAADFEQRVNAEEVSTGRTVGRQRRTEILDQMMKEGLVPSIATAYSESLSENLELTAWQHDLLARENVKIFHDTSPDIARIYYDEKGEHIQKDTDSSTTALTARNPSLDVGVAGVVGTIHALDGTNAADIFGVMSLRDHKDVSEQGNQRFYQQHHDYDMGQELNKSLERMMALVEPGDGRLSANQRHAVGMAFIAELKRHLPD